MSKSVMISIVSVWLGIIGGPAFAQSGTLHEGQYLFPGQKLVASGCFFETLTQTDGNLVTYKNAQSSSPRPAWWASGTQNVGGYATLQKDNNFVIYNWNGQPVWATGTNGWGPDQLVQQADGNLVLYSLSGQSFWDSGRNGEALGQSPCTASSVVTQVSLNTDYPGADYAHFTIPVARAIWCGYYCAQGSKCQAYSYVPPGVQGPSAVCWLKTGISQVRSTTGFVSGYKVVRK